MYNRLTRRLKTVASSLLVLGVLGSGAATMAAEETGVKVFQYDSLSDSIPQIKEQFHNKGYIAIQGVPGFKEAWGTFLEEGLRPFAALSNEEKSKCTPATGSDARGWSVGIEQLIKGFVDHFKESYYIKYPEVETSPNIWPQTIPQFKETYLKLAKVMFNTQLEVLGHMSKSVDDIQGLGRVLYYRDVLPENDDGSKWWNTLHCDHGWLTGLTPEIYVKDGQIVPKPEGTGLHILGKEISVSDDIMLIQIGEVMELASDGELTATKHEVLKAFGYKRFAVAMFLDVPDDFVINCTNDLVKQKYKDRYEEGITYKEWGDKSLRKYNPSLYGQDSSLSEETGCCK